MCFMSPLTEYNMSSGPPWLKKTRVKCVLWPIPIVCECKTKSELTFSEVDSGMAWIIITWDLLNITHKAYVLFLGKVVVYLALHDAPHCFF